MKSKKNKVVKACDKLLSWICKRAGEVATISILLLTGLVMIDIILRRFFNRPITFSFEIITFGLLLIVFCSITYTTELGRHVSIDLVTLRFPKKIRLISKFLVDFLSGLFFLILTWRCIIHALFIQEMGAVSGTLRIPLYPFYFFMAFCFLVVSLIVILRSFRELRGDIQK